MECAPETNTVVAKARSERLVEEVREKAAALRFIKVIYPARLYVGVRQAGSTEILQQLRGLGVLAQMLQLRGRTASRCKILQ